LNCEKLGLSVAIALAFDYLIAGVTLAVNKLSMQNRHLQQVHPRVYASITLVDALFTPTGYSTVWSYQGVS
jgi:hypothetical protein